MDQAALVAVVKLQETKSKQCTLVRNSFLSYNSTVVYSGQHPYQVIKPVPRQQPLGWLPCVRSGDVRRTEHRICYRCVRGGTV